MDLTQLSLSKAQDLISTHEITAVELTTAHLARIERFDPLVNSFITQTADKALQRAAEADRAIGAGEPVGALHGLPLAVKDLFATEGVPTTAGSAWIKKTISLQTMRLLSPGCMRRGLWYSGSCTCTSGLSE